MSWKNILEHFNYAWVNDDIWYVMFSGSSTPYSVKKYLQRNIKKTKRLIREGKIPSYRYKFKSRDKIILECFKWVTKNIKYKDDKSNFGKDEYWEDVDIIIKNKVADCESMSLLLFCMARVNCINPLQIKYKAGRVKTLNKPILGEGHSWLEYMADETMFNDKWYVLDPAYEPNNITEFKYRKTTTQLINYTKTWFEVTDIEVEK